MILKINWSMKDWEGKATKQGDCKICKQQEKLNENNVCLECWLGLDGDTKKTLTNIIEKCCRICLKEFYQKPLKSDTEGFYSDEAIGHDFRNYVVNICPTCKKTPIEKREVDEGRCPKCGSVNEGMKRITYISGTRGHKHELKAQFDNLGDYWDWEGNSDEEEVSECVDSGGECHLTKEKEYCPECNYKNVIHYGNS